RGGLDVFHSGKIALELRQQVGLGAALEHLCNKSAAGIEHVGGKRGGVFNEADDPELIGLAVAGGVGGHVGQHHVGAAADHLDQFFGCVVAKKIELGKTDAGNFGHFEQVDRDHLALAVDRADALGGDLAP